MKYKNIPFYRARIFLVALIAYLSTVYGCNSTPERLQVKTQLTSTYELVNQDSQSVAFPKDFNDSYLIVGYIYTHCQSVCPAITANMVRIEETIEQKAPVKFVGISFDPHRDKPRVLREYMRRFDIASDRFSFLTGDTTVINRLLEKVKVHAWKKTPKDTSAEAGSYMYVHTNRIHLIDPEGNVRGSYRGSQVSPNQLKKDLSALRE